MQWNEGGIEVRKEMTLSNEKFGDTLGAKLNIQKGNVLRCYWIKSEKRKGGNLRGRRVFLRRKGRKRAVGKKLFADECVKKNVSPAR